MKEEDWDVEDKPWTISEGFGFSGIFWGFMFILWLGTFSYLLTRFWGDLALGTDDNTDGVNEVELFLLVSLCVDEIFFMIFWDLGLFWLTGA